MIAAINRVEVAGTNWTVILAHDGIISFLKLVTSDACNIIDEVNLKMKISLNADSLEVNKNLILVKFNNGLFKLYQVDEHEIKSRDGDVVSSVKMSHRKTWNLTEQIKTEFGDEYICQMGNISRMNYKNRGRTLPIFNKTCLNYTFQSFFVQLSTFTMTPRTAEISFFKQLCTFQSIRIKSYFTKQKNTKKMQNQAPP